MYIKVVALILVFSGLACGASWEFTGNFSVSVINNNEWTYRPINFDVFDLEILGWLGANYWSSVVSGNILNASVDLVTGSAYIAQGGFPFSFLTYFKDSYSLNIGIGGGQSFANLDVNAAAGYIGTAYLALEEVAPNGTVVATKSLQWAGLFQSGLSWSQTASDSSDDTLNYVTYNATDDNSNVKISITFLISSVAGILNENINMAPKSLESVVAISGYPYQSTANSLRLVLGVGSGGATVSVSDNTVYSQNSNVYFALNDQVSVGGTLTKAEISGYSSGNIDSEVDNSNFKSQLQGKYNSSWSFNIVKVTFPAGANNIVYDPSQGSGNPAISPSSPAPIVVGSLFFVVAALLALLL